LFMPDNVAVKTFAQPKGVIGAQSARRRFVPAQREPLHLPEEKVELPSPTQAPPPPPSINLLTSILPPALMLIGTLVAALFSRQNSTGPIIMVSAFSMFLMSLGIPVANIISVRSQKKAYLRSLEQRETAYKQKLGEAQKYLDDLAAKQRTELEAIYPDLPALQKIVLTRSKLLWSRRPADDDFLSLRIGYSDGLPSFTVEPPRYYDPNDKLLFLATDILRKFQKIPRLPALLQLGQVGSVAITGRLVSSVYNLTRRLVLDILVHHSPQDVHLAVLGDTREAVNQWEWLKWLPHTDALGTERHLPHLAFDSYKVDKFLEFLVAEYHRRFERADDLASSKKRSQAAYVVLIDDSGQVRQRGDIPLLAEWGHEANIYLVFVGGRDWPRECRSRIDVLGDKQFKFTETWRKSGNIITGDYESATLADCERVARTLAGLEVAGTGSRLPLPESVRLSQVLGAENLSVEAVKQTWQADFAPKDLLQFPIGVCAQRDQLDLAMINLLPAEFGGNDAYHTILIGTTGSGKSEFMKSLVMGAAVAYPPNLLNFFFLDFKGGAAFSIFEDLPHVSGVVTNLRPELVERGLDSIKNEIARRQEEFSKSRVQRIWDYNLHADHPMPHLVLFLDEFARGLAEFPRLREVLDILVRQGRSLGMYLILANQDVNAEVDKLLNNVGWRIALKVAKPEELSMIDRRLPNPTRAGQGYLRSLNGDITEFQAGYGGFAVQSAETAETDGFVIYQVEPDGGYKPFFKQTGPSLPVEKKSKGPVLKEEEFILSILKQAAMDLHIKPAPRIYLDPLPETIPLEAILTEAGVTPAYVNGKWRKEKGAGRIVAYWGEQDIPEECLQETLKTDFSERDGHLWIVGAQGSGKDMALTTLLLSLALTYTPEQVQFYLLELGSGELTALEMLPHTGAMIRPLNQERERLVRLLNFLDAEMDRRTAGRAMTEEGTASRFGPSLFVVINNYAELRANFPDESDRLLRFVRDGKPAGIHVIVVTSRGPELIRSVSNNIARRLVLQLGSRDEYLDIIGRQTRPLNDNIPGRGYWVDGNPCECQIAQPPAKLRELMRRMRESWKGTLPRPIEILPACIPLSAVLADLGTSRQKGQMLLPVGRDYETLNLVAPGLTDSIPFWLILGPKESGKSNFLACVGKSVLQQDPEGWLVKAYAFRRSPLIALGQEESRLQVLSAADEILKDCLAMTETLKAGQPLADGKKLLLLVDDLGFAFQPGKEALLSALNTLAQNLESTTDVYIMATGLMDELRMQLASSFLKLLKQGRTGMVLSKDTNELDWLGAQISLEYRRMDVPVGRGFFVNKGRPLFVQTPLLGECKK
jgi:S-DNA-T family DNA segregation ATPase FtsK/SpoIIIE